MSKQRRKPGMWMSTNKFLIGGGSPKVEHISLSSKKTHLHRNPNFEPSETKLLISLWGDPKIQKALYTTHRKYPVIAKIAMEMENRGYIRTPEEVNTRIKNLKCFYNRIKKDLESGVIPYPTWRHYQAMDKIMTTPVFSVRPNEIPKPSPRFKMEPDSTAGDSKSEDVSEDESFPAELLSTELSYDDDDEEGLDGRQLTEKDLDIEVEEVLVPKEEPIEVVDDDDEDERIPIRKRVREEKNNQRPVIVSKSELTKPDAGASSYVLETIFERPSSGTEDKGSINCTMLFQEILNLQDTVERQQQQINELKNIVIAQNEMVKNILVENNNMLKSNKTKPKQTSKLLEMFPVKTQEDLDRLEQRILEYDEDEMIFAIRNLTSRGIPKSWNVLFSPDIILNHNYDGSHEKQAFKDYKAINYILFKATVDQVHTRDNYVRTVKTAFRMFKNRHYKSVCMENKRLNKSRMMEASQASEVITIAPRQPTELKICNAQCKCANGLSELKY